MNFKVTQTRAAIAAIALFVVSVTLALCLTFCKSGATGNEGGSEINKPPKNDGSITTSADYTYKTDISAVADALNTTSVEYLLLANRNMKTILLVL